MDLRVLRTRNSIRQAFMALRAKKELEKITVTELAELAMINKATFYQHYQDIYDLSRQLEDELIASTLAAVKNPKAMLNDPTAAIREILEVAQEHSQSYLIFFSGARRMELLAKLEEAFLKKLSQTYPELMNQAENQVILSFLVQGCFYTFLNHPELDKAMLTAVTGALCEKVMAEFHISQNSEIQNT